jgi:hypothetical protein
MEKPDTGVTNTSDVLLVEKAPVKPAGSPDLSAEIALTVERAKGERVKCRRIFGDNYRCNWLAVDDRAVGRGTSLAVDTYHVRASKFLRVRKVGEALVIEDATNQAARRN